MQHEADVNAYITKYTSMRQHSVQDFLQENPELAPPKSPSSYGLDETTTKLKSTETPGKPCDDSHPAAISIRMQRDTDKIAYITMYQSKPMSSDLDIGEEYLEHG